MLSTSLGARWSHQRDVIATLVGREFKGRYKNTAMGMAWSVISPLMFLLVFYFLFEKVLDLGIPRYASFAFTGIVAWMWFQGTLSEAVTSISSNASLVSQPGFPVATLPVVAVTSNLVNFLIALPLLAGLLLIEGARPGLSLIALPLLFALQYLLALSFAYVVAAFNVHFRDTQYILPIMLQLGYYVTPIFYDLKRVPPEYHSLFNWNPMVPLVQGYRAILLEGAWPDWRAIAAVALVSLAVLFLGYRYFRHASYRFLEDL
jgi:ABC-type polysaccharide/polyol phosphate export permease